MADKNPKTGTPSESTKHLQNLILEMYAMYPNFDVIARKLEYSNTYIKKLYRQALKAIIVDNVQDLRKLEAHRIDQIIIEANNILKAIHPMVSGGTVVRDVVDGPTGEPLLREGATPGDVNSYVTTRVFDYTPRLAAIDRILRASERRAKLFGLDAPTKTAITDPSGEKEASFVQFYLPSNGRDETQEPG